MVDERDLAPRGLLRRVQLHLPPRAAACAGCGRNDCTGDDQMDTTRDDGSDDDPDTRCPGPGSFKACSKATPIDLSGLTAYTGPY